MTSNMASDSESESELGKGFPWWQSWWYSQNLLTTKHLLYCLTFYQGYECLIFFTLGVRMVVTCWCLDFGFCIPQSNNFPLDPGFAAQFGIPV